jgi:hypothetical protein
MFFKYGVNAVQSLVDDVANIPASQIDEYCVIHEDSLDGG